VCRSHKLKLNENARPSFESHGPLSPGATIPTLFLPTVTLGFRPFGLELASVFIEGIAAPNHFEPTFSAKEHLEWFGAAIPTINKEASPNPNSLNPNVTVGRNSVGIAAPGDSVP
jgi:hypothetical protein